MIIFHLIQVIYAEIFVSAIFYAEFWVVTVLCRNSQGSYAEKYRGSYAEKDSVIFFFLLFMHWFCYFFILHPTEVSLMQIYAVPRLTYFE